MSFDSIINRAEFFSDHYLAARLASDLDSLRKKWDAAEGKGEPTARRGLRSVPKPFFDARSAVAEAGGRSYADAVRAQNDVVLSALGFVPDRREVSFSRATAGDELVVPVAVYVDTATGPLLVAVDSGATAESDELFDIDEREGGAAPGWLLSPILRDGGKTAIKVAADAPGEIFSVDEPPRFVLIVGGSSLLLAERSKWAEGRYLAVELDAALERVDTKARGELETIAALFSADALVPGHLDLETDTEASGLSFFDAIDEEQNRHAVGVSKELRDGMRRSVEILANEVIEQRRTRNLAVYSGPNAIDARELTRQCLRYLYRLIVLLYAESRPELGVLPVNDDAYLAGYSLDRLRELVLVELDDERARNGTHLDESLSVLFDLVNEGYHATSAVQSFVFEADLTEMTRSIEDHIQFPGLDATIFDAGSTPLLDSVPLRNAALQQVLVLLMLNREGKGKRDQRGFISYAQLGINQLGAVYEGLMAYTGFFADEDLYELAKGGDPSGGTWMVPVTKAAEYPDDVFVHADDPLTGVSEKVLHQRGSFVYRLAGRDRQRSASYYTPEILTECVVRHALAELLGTDDHARVPGGSAGITEAKQILDLTICEPALGSGAFLNEAINQMSAEYLKRRQAELGETLDADRYQRELQKVKAHFALHQSYGVDLNATAVELAEVSLWLNCMYPGLKAPWFGLRLRRGNSLIGCRRATWRVSELKKRVWAKDKVADALPPTDRPLAEPLEPDEIHHFLLPGHGWGAVAGRKEAKELAPDETERLKAWRKGILSGPTVADGNRLMALAAGVERHWAEATDLLERLDRRMRRPIDIYGVEGSRGAPDDDRRAAEKILNNPDSSLGRLRLVMDAWVGLWFWTLDGEVNPPRWQDWLGTLELLIGPETTECLGQLDLFADLAAIEEAEALRAATRAPVGDIVANTPWLAKARELAQREGAWHWPLEFAPLFRGGGFDLQVGNPPWVRPRWDDDLALAEADPWWGITDKAAENVRRARRANDLTGSGVRANYLGEVASHEGVVTTLGSVQLRPVLAGIHTNLYMAFMDTTWRHLSPRGAVGLLHPEGHFVGPEAGQLRYATYGRLRRHFMFYNELRFFEEVDHHTEYSLNIYGTRQPIGFLNAANLMSPGMVDGSLNHDGTGSLPAIKYPEGGWDLRPHRDRIVTVDLDVLADWARLFDEPGTPSEQARLLRPVTRQDLGALSVLAGQPVRLADHSYFWTRGHEEDRAKRDGIIRWETTVPNSWDEVIMQGPHFTVATPFAKQPNVACGSNKDYSDWDLEALPEHVIPRTNYQRATDRATYDANLSHWNGRPSTDRYRHIHREMTQPGLERSVQGALVPLGATHIHACLTYGFDDSVELLRWAGLMASVPIDYLFKASGSGHVAEHQLSRLPFPNAHPLDEALAIRVMRLNSLVAEYAGLWSDQFDSAWTQDSWTDPAFSRVKLGDIGPTWTMETPLRRDFERRLALVEIDALVALILGLTAEQLCAMYRTQFAVLRKYEFAMAFDAHGRKVCKHHQSAGFRQARLQQEAKDKQRAPQWKNVWAMVEQWEDDPDSVDFEGEFTPPLTRVDREAEMTRAYIEFERRLAAGDYG